MGRMIDEGELVKVLKERATNEAICGYMTAYDVTNSIIDEVKEQPTAYDPDEDMAYNKGIDDSLNAFKKVYSLTLIEEEELEEIANKLKRGETDGN